MGYSEYINVKASSEFIKERHYHHLMWNIWLYTYYHLFFHYLILGFNKIYNSILFRPIAMDFYFNETLLEWVLCVISVFRVAFQLCGQSRQNSLSFFTESFKKNH